MCRPRFLSLCPFVQEKAMSVRFLEQIYSNFENYKKFAIYLVLFRFLTIR